MYIPIEALKIDTAVSDIIDSGDNLDNYYSAIDRCVISVARKVALIPASQIPVDSEGYLLSMPLFDVAVSYGIAIILRGYNAIGNGNTDDIYSKWENYMSDYLEKLNSLTKDDIVDGGEEAIPDYNATIAMRPVIV